MAKYGRRKPVTCLLCDGQTYDEKRICDTCRRMHRIGCEVDKARRAQEGSKQPYIFPAKALRHPIPGQEKDGNKQQMFDLEKFIEAMTGEPSSSAWLERDYPHEGIMLNPRIILPEWLPEAKRMGYWNGGRAWGNLPIVQFYLTEAQANALRLLLHSVDDQLKEYQQRGEREGSYFLKQMARGELKMDDINNWHMRHEKTEA